MPPKIEKVYDMTTIAGLGEYKDDRLADLEKQRVELYGLLQAHKISETEVTLRHQRLIEQQMRFENQIDALIKSIKNISPGK